MVDVTPLPPALSGNIVERLILIDEALLYLVNGALSWLTDKEPLQPTGALTVDDARDALSAMLWDYFNEEPNVIPIGATMEWWNSTPPAKWKLLQGTTPLSKTTYPELFAIFGYSIGGAGDSFLLPSMSNYSPMGVGAVSLFANAGAFTHTLTTPEIPAHNHTVNDPGHFHITKNRAGVPTWRHTGVAGANPSAADPVPSTTNSANVSDTTNVGTGISLASAGGGGSHNNLHPVKGLYFIIYAGR